MDKQTLDFVTAHTRALMEAFSCCAEAKQAAQAWLDALGTEKEAQATRAYLRELEEDIVPVEDLIALADSPAGKEIFGDQAPQVAAHGRQIQAAGAKYCDCPACAACQAILSQKDRMV